MTKQKYKKTKQKQKKKHDKTYKRCKESKLTQKYYYQVKAIDLEEWTFNSDG